MTKALAVLCSDIHFSHKPPAARSGESDWYSAMAKTINEVAHISSSLGEGPCPVIAAGDIFDRWNPPPELINFAIDVLSKFSGAFYCIPGQHDLPNHRYDEMHRSAYGALVRTPQAKDLRPDCQQTVLLAGNRPLVVHPFPWGHDITPVDRLEWKSDSLHLAVVHSYIWKSGKGHPGADEEDKVGRYVKQLETYDCAVFGDNHQGFVANRNRILNCGTLMRRRSDEIDYQPRVGILREDGTIDLHHLDTRDEVMDSTAGPDIETEEYDFDDLFSGLRSFDLDSIDFRDCVLRILDDVGADDQVRTAVLSSVDSQG